MSTFKSTPGLYTLIDTRQLAKLNDFGQPLIGADPFLEVDEMG